MNYRDALNVEGLKVPKTGAYVIEVEITGDNCLSCCGELEPLAPSKWKKCILKGVPVFTGFDSYNGSEPTTVTPTISIQFDHCLCC